MTYGPHSFMSLQSEVKGQHHVWSSNNIPYVTLQTPNISQLQHHTAVLQHRTTIARGRNFMSSKKTLKYKYLTDRIWRTQQLY